MTKIIKSAVIAEWAGFEQASGTIEAQVGILTERVKMIAGHLEKNHKDHSSRRGLLKMVGKRRRLMKYLESQNPEKAAELTKKIKS